MNISTSARYAMSALVTLAVLSACNTGGSALTPTSNHIVATFRYGRTSWMKPEAKRTALLYGANFSTNQVDVYTYPQGKHVGTLSGFNEPSGECVDQTGNVYIANTGTSQIIEYAHGGTSPIATLNDPNQYPVSCSVSPSSGDLAVSNVLSGSGGPGSVSIYKPGHTSPKTYYDSTFFRMYFLGYDLNGNLFVDGSNPSGAFEYAELPKGSKKFTDITLDKTIQFPGDVQYDGTYIAIGDQGNANIYQTSGGTVVGTTTLGGASQVGTFFIFGGKVLCPSSCGADLAVYAYPAGGAPLRTLNLAGGAPGVVVISK